MPMRSTCVYEDGRLRQTRCYLVIEVEGKDNPTPTLMIDIIDNMLESPADNVSSLMVVP